MEKKREIWRSRQRLNETLALHDLVNEESIKSLVKDQLLLTSSYRNEGDLANVVERRAKEVSNFLEMLRSASGNERDASNTYGASRGDWKMKQDTDQLRVMYHEGPDGSPFHTLLAEGFADGPVDVCLCASWESTLYKKWWPQYNIPTFKITMSTCLNKIRIGEEISLVRMKVPWPISDREALLHYFEIRYDKEDLILVLINTISDKEHIDVSSHGFTRDGIPEASDTVRIDLVGGLVLQKIDANRSYFRAMANMDIKLDFMPPSLINFISRQLMGSAHKLFQKVVGSVSNDDDYCKALEGPMYARIREGLDSRNKHKVTSINLEEGRHAGTSIEDRMFEPAILDLPANPSTFVAEIVEVEDTHRPHLEGSSSMIGSPTNAITDQKHTIQRPLISPEVEHALGLLDRAIAIIREGGFSNIQGCGSLVERELPCLESVEEADCLNDEEPPKNSSLDKPFDEDESQPSDRGFRYNGDESPLEERLSTSVSTTKTNLNRSHDKLIGSAIAPIQSSTFFDNVKVCDEQSLGVSGFHETGPYRGDNKPNRNKKHRFCCLSLSFFKD